MPGEKFSFFPQGPITEKALARQIPQLNDMSSKSKSSKEALRSPVNQQKIAAHHLHCQTSVPSKTQLQLS